jgi:hypothetical protein
MQNNFYTNALGEIRSLLPPFRRVLEDNYGYTFIVYTNNSDRPYNNSPTSEFGYLHLLIINEDLSKKPILERINGPRSVSEITSEILESFDIFLNDYSCFFDKIEELEVDNQTTETYDMISKVLKNRKKKLENSLKKFHAEIVDTWDVTRIREEFCNSLSKSISDIIDSILRPCLAGIRSNNSYEKVIKLLNEFLMSLSIYTLPDVTVETELSPMADDFMDPEESDETWTIDLTKKGLIKQLISYPYVIKINCNITPIMNGKALFWKIGVQQ